MSAETGPVRRGRGPARGEATDTTRLEAFADGVMAIAITLLILDIKTPHVPGSELGHALAHEWPGYVGYVVSFVTIGVMWVNHHHMFKLIERTNHVFLMMNVLFLLTIAFLPWPTSLVAAYVRDPTGRQVAALVYGLTMVAIAVMFNVVWRYASGRGRLLVEGCDPAVIARTRRSYLVFGVGMYSVATLLTVVAPVVSLAIYAALAAYWLLPSAGPRSDMRPGAA